MKKKKKFLSILLSVMLLAGICPASVYASISGEDNETEIIGVGGEDNETEIIVIEDEVKATFDEKTGALVFSAKEGTLPANWAEKFGLDKSLIKSISAEGTVYFPNDSSVLFEDCTELKTFDSTNFSTSKVQKMDDAFVNCYKLQTIETPLNLTCKADLPFTMYDADGNEYTSLPRNAKSVHIASSQILAAGGFKDVQDPGMWYYDSVYWAAANKVTSGYGSGVFKPDATLTRGMVVTFLYNFAGSPDADVYPAPNFTDVKENDWFYNAVRWANGTGVTGGYGTGTFKPYTTCTRAMIMSFFIKYAKYQGFYTAPKTTSSFKDVFSTDWYKDAVDWAVENKITSGYGSNTFKPNASCTRAMMVVFLNNLQKIIPPVVY